MKAFARTILAIGTLAGIAPAAAADLPTIKDAQPVAAPVNWSGFYIGLNAGLQLDPSAQLRTTAAPIFTGIVPAGQVGPLTAFANETVNLPGRTSFLGGAQVGYILQFGAIVGGLEADLQALAGSSSSGRFTSLNAIGAVPVITEIDASRRLDFLGTVRARLGVSLAPMLLVYATGGLAYGALTSRTSVVQIGTTLGRVGVGDANQSGLRAGWTLGGGGEWMFAPRWSAKLEYLYFEIGERSYTSVLAVAAPAAIAGTPYSSVRHSVRTNGHILRAGLNYRFSVTP